MLDRILLGNGDSIRAREKLGWHSPREGTEGQNPGRGISLLSGASFTCSGCCKLGLSGRNAQELGIRAQQWARD